MDERLKRRVVGAAVLVVAAVVFVPMLLEQGREAPQPPVSPPPTSLQPPPPPPPAPPEDTHVRVMPLEPSVPAVPASQPKPAKAPESAPAREKTPAKAARLPAAGAPPVKSGFAVQLGSFSKADNALGLRDKLKAKGYKAFVKTSGSVTRVYVGPQQNRAEAEKALKKLLADIKMKGIVVNFSG